MTLPKIVQKHPRWILEPYFFCRNLRQTYLYSEESWWKIDFLRHSRFSKLFKALATKGLGWCGTKLIWHFSIHSGVLCKRLCEKWKENLLYVIFQVCSVVRLCQVRIRLPTLALKLREDVTRSPKQRYQWPLRHVSSKLFLKKEEKNVFCGIHSQQAKITLLVWRNYSQ